MAGFDQMAKQLMDLGGNDGSNGGQGPGQGVASHPNAPSQRPALAPQAGNDDWMTSPQGVMRHIFGSNSGSSAAPAQSAQPAPQGWRPPQVLTPQTQPPAPPAPPAPGAPDPGMGPPPPPIDQTPVNSPWGGTMGHGETLGSIFQSLLSAGRPTAPAGPPMPALTGGGTPAQGVPLPSVGATSPFDAMATRYGAAGGPALAPQR
jgi:hypothetical protein